MDANAAAEQAYREALQELQPAENLARLIIHRRTELGLTQQEVAERMGTSHSVISRLESGQHQVSLRTLRRVARAFESRLVVGFVPEPKSVEGTEVPELATV